MREERGAWGGGDVEIHQEREREGRKRGGVKMDR